jgi:hypothetical protein
MELSIAGASRTLIPVHEFRSKQKLPVEFGVELFASKDYTSLGSIERAGDALQHLKTTLLDAIPYERPPQGWLAFTLSLQLRFHQLLWQINPCIGLRASEIQYASSGFGDVCQAYVSALMAAQLDGRPLPDFETQYHQWIDQSVMISAVAYSYAHPVTDDCWQIRLVQTLYGITGMIVETERETYFVQDAVLGCPTSGYMGSLLSAVAGKIKIAFSADRFH